MLQNRFPLLHVEHLRQVVFNGVWAFGDGVQDDVPGKPNTDLLEDQGSLRDHQQRQLLHLISRAQSLALLLIGILTDHGDLCVFSFDEGLEAHEVEVAGH